MTIKITAIDLMPIRDYWSARTKPKTRVYMSFSESVWENLENRHSRPWKAIKPLLENMPGAERLTFRWSQKAGCNCGCSPGFIVDGWSPTLSGKNAWIKVEGVA